MRRILFLRLLLLCLVATITFPACKKDKKNNDGSGGSTETASTVSTMLNNAENAAKKYEEALQGGKDSIDAILEMGKWLIEQPEVAEVYFINLDVVEVYYKNGMQNIISVVATDANGKPKWRGGGDDGGNKRRKLQLKNYSKSTADDHIIQNKKVLIFSPYNSEFYGNQYPFLSKFTDGKVKLEPTLVANSDATLSVLNSFKDYGLIIINSHGVPQGFEINCKVSELNVPHAPGSKVFTPELIKSMFTDANDMPLEKFENGELIIGIKIIRSTSNSTLFRVGTLVTEKYIRNLPRLDNAVVFGNYCYSGYTYEGPVERNISEAFKSIGAISYYGYGFPDGGSARAELSFTKRAEDTLISNLVKGDSTGIAHLNDDMFMLDDVSFERSNPKKVKSTVELTREGLMFQLKAPDPDEPLFFMHFIDPEYKYGCGTFTDPRDGEVYELACAGDKRWFAENLRYNVPGSTTVNGSQVNLKEFGRLYTYRMATGDSVTCDPNQPGSIRGICPEGWHVANHYDFLQLRNAIGASDLVELSTRLKSGSSLWVGDPHLNDPRRNSSGFNAYPTGWAYKDNNTPNFIYQSVESGRFWLSSVQSQMQYQVGHVNIYGDASFSNLSWGGEIGFSDDVYMPCRCVED